MRFQEWMAKKNELIQLTLKKKEFKRGNRLEVILKSEMNSIHWIVQKFKKFPKKSEIRFSINILFGGRGGGGLRMLWAYRNWVAVFKRDEFGGEAGKIRNSDSKIQMLKNAGKFKNSKIKF